MSFPEVVSFLTGNINPYSGLPGILFFLLFIGKMGRISRYAYYILLASFLSDFGIQLFIRYVYPNSFIISNSWYVINYLLVSWLYILMMPRRKKLIFILTFVFLAGGFLSFLTFYSFLESNTFIRTYSSVAFTILPILTFFEILKEDQPINYFFILSSGLTQQFSCLVVSPF